MAFTPDQTVFTLSLIANIGAGLTGSDSQIETTLAQEIDAALIKYKDDIGSWKIIWGPAIYQSPGIESVRTDNTMYVAQKSDEPNRIVIAIAGTNAYSIFDWLIEDAFVTKLVPWEYGNPPAELKPCLASGIYRGLTKLQVMQPGPDLPGKASTLVEFLMNLPNLKLDITVTGHSLGGALAPVTSLWLSDTQTSWDPANRAKFSCLSTAGPTPGNEDFSKYYANSLLDATTKRIHNTLDVVPHAWNNALLSLVPDLYSPDIKPDILIRALIGVAKLISINGNYQHIKVDATGLQGTFKPLPNTSNKIFDQFVKQLAFQHVDNYLILMEIPKLQEELDQVRQAAQLLGSQGAIAALGEKLLRLLAMAKLRGDSIT